VWLRNTKPKTSKEMVLPLHLLDKSAITVVTARDYGGKYNMYSRENFLK